MLSFSRFGTLDGAHIREGLAFVNEVTDCVIEVTGKDDISVYSALFGAPVGSIAWATTFDSHAEFGDLNATLMMNDDYLALVEKGTPLFLGPPEQVMREVIDTNMTEAPAVVGVVTARAKVDQIAKAIEWGVDIHQYATGVTGTSGAFLVDLYGPMGSMTWYGGGPDLASLDESNSKLNADPGYLRRLEDTGNLFIEGTGQQAILQRIR